ncbi:MAG: hypothetical protein ACK5Y2_05910 [Bdellovibrionales bacterium]
MKASLSKIFLKVGVILLFLLMNFIGLRAFSATELPSCQLASEGYVQNQWRSVRIRVNDAIVAGSETLSGLVRQFSQLVAERKCLPSPVPCSLAPEGLAVGVWAKHRVLIQDVAAFGANSTARVLDQLSELKKVGVCQ